MDSALPADRARPRGPRCASGAVLVPRLLVERALLEARTATGGLTLVLAQLDQLAGDPGALEGVPRARGQVHRQLDDRVVRADVDLAEVTAAQAALVGECADDLAGLDLVALADLDAIGRHRDVAAACGALAAGAAVLTVATALGASTTVGTVAALRALQIGRAHV